MNCQTWETVNESEGEHETSPVKNITLNLRLNMTLGVEKS